MTGTGTGFKDGKKIDTAFLTLEVEGKYYMVTIDMNSETVKSIEEQQFSVTGFSISTGPDGETTWSEGVPEGVPEGVHRPPIQKR